ncbi:MAG: cytochrome c3 family protein [Bacillota bacterium]|nr:cytochrome c3 family protein [Bacillota bacterium]
MGSKHDLSLSGPGPVKAVTESQICLFCHTPHNANPAAPLWSHTLSSQTYTLYTAETLQGTTGQPDGTSKLCLSCHDGTVALGSLGNPAFRTIAMSGTAPDGTMPAGTSDLGTDLANDHPVSIMVNLTDPEIVTPLAGDPVQLYANKVQCTSCHDPHDPQYGAVAGGPGKFLVKANDDGIYGSQLCLSCHNKAGWSSSAHRNATDLYNGRLGNLAVSRYACEACHRPHTAARPVWLREGSSEEGGCLVCHGSAGPGDNVSAIGTGSYGHQVDNYSNVHKPVGDGTGGTEPALLNNTHVECTDCHQPHRTQVQPGQGTRSMGTNQVDATHGQSLSGMKVRRVTYGTGAWVPPTFGLLSDVAYEYEVCLRCHSTGSAAFTAGSERGSLDVYFNPNNQAHHAVVAPGKIQKTQMNNTFVSGSGLTISSTIYCSDCHDPHSTNRWLLKQSSVADANGNRFVCYNCHRVDVYGPGARNASLGAWTDHAKAAHHNPSNFIPPAWWPTELRNFSCLWCHGDFGSTKDGSYEPGGIHGANRGSTTYSKVDSGIHFLNGVAIEWRDNGGTSRTCGDYWTGSVGCNHHDGTSPPSVNYTANW